jgi:hypothetical protein
MLAEGLSAETNATSSSLGSDVLNLGAVSVPLPSPKTDASASIEPKLVTGLRTVTVPP